MKRATAVLVLGLVLGVALTASPASGHLKGSVAHLVGHMKTVFFTKAESDARFVNVGEKVQSAAQSDRATTATRADTATNATNAEDAENAERLGGLGPTQFLRANAKAADSDKLDGLDSGSFMRLSMWNAVYARYKVTVGFNSQGQGCVGNDTCGDTARCDPDDVAVGGGYLGVDNGTHVQNASAVSNAAGDVLSLTGPPRMFHLLWRNNATADEVNIVVWCVDMSAV